MLSFLCEKAKESFLAGKVRWPSRKQLERYCKAKSGTKRLLRAIRPFNTGKRETNGKNRREERNPDKGDRYDLYYI